MLKESLTEIIFVLDKSGSMESIRKETVVGFNDFVHRQLTEPGETKISLILFDTKYSVLYSGIPLQEAIDLTFASYEPDGGTALLDALGTAIDRTGQRLAEIAPNERPSKVIVVILTDGQENSSQEYSVQQVLDKVRHQTKVYGWEFIFLGANQDAWLEAGKLGISRAVEFVADKEGVALVYDFLQEAVVQMKGTRKRK
jgi:Mg-chelatase subunit ChlD